MCNYYYIGTFLSFLFSIACILKKVQCKNYILISNMLDVNRRGGVLNVEVIVPINLENTFDK